MPEVKARKTPINDEYFENSFNSLIPLIGFLRERRHTSPYSDKDARKLFFSGVELTLKSSFVALNAADQFYCSKNENDRRDLLRLLGLAGVSKEEILDTFYAVLFSAKLNLLNTTYFLFDSALKKYYKVLFPGQDVPNSFFDRLSDISKKFNKNIENFSALLVLGAMRNSQHNDGIHNSRDFTKNIENFTFVFKKGEVVDQVQIVQICCLIKNSINQLDEIIKIPEIMSKQEILSDGIEQTDFVN